MFRRADPGSRTRGPPVPDLIEHFVGHSAQMAQFDEVSDVVWRCPSAAMVNQLRDPQSIRQPQGAVPADGPKRAEPGLRSGGRNGHCAPRGGPLPAVNPHDPRVRHATSVHPSQNDLEGSDRDEQWRCAEGYDARVGWPSRQHAAVIWAGVIMMILVAAACCISVGGRRQDWRQRPAWR